MLNDNIIKAKSRAFSTRIIRLYKYLCDIKKEFILSKQILRSGTSIYANIAESECAQSRKDFFAKLYVAYKECSETLSWLDMLKNGEYLTQAQFDSIYKDCKEIIKILASITKHSNC